MEQMRYVVKTDILAVINDSISLLNAKDFENLKNISNHVTHNASIFQDADSITIAVVIYSLSKIGERAGMSQAIQQKVLDQLEQCKELLQQDKFDQYRNSMKNLIRLILKMDKKLAMYVDHVTEKAQIHKGGKLHQHGISIARAAQVLGISRWELMSYIGKTKIHDSPVTHDGVKSRMAFTRALFGLGKRQA